MSEDELQQVRRAVTRVAAGLIGQGAEVERQVAALRPTDSEVEALIVREGVQPLLAHLDRVFRPGATPAIPADHTELAVVTAMAGLLGEDNAFSRRFPGGYRRLAPLLLPLTPWSCVRFSPSGDDTRSVLVDGLAWTGTRVVWVPKPFRVVPRTRS